MLKLHPVCSGTLGGLFHPCSHCWKLHYFCFQTWHSEEQVFSNLAHCLLLSMDSAVISVFCRPVPTSSVAQIKHFKAYEVCFFDCASVPEGLVYLVRTPMPLKRKLHIRGTCLYCRRCKLKRLVLVRDVGLLPCTLGGSAFARNTEHNVEITLFTISVNCSSTPLGL